MAENPEKNYLFGSMEKYFIEERKKFEETRSILKNRELYARIRQIIYEATKGSSDNIHSERGTIVEGDTITLTAADFKYQGLIEPGETALTKSTNWFPQGQREINGEKVDFSISFNSIDFIKISDEGNDSRPGPVRIKGKLTDQDGFTIDYPLVIMQESTKKEKMDLLYCFGSEIPYGCEDYTDVVKMVNSAEEQLKQKPH